ncbi:hypothetical protein ACHAW5_003946 [Stephanodiscus triporus]|uniref:Uncharacterized protein n=1 Tax=Stephanodiscus triporus TaxID=2934178 RepID=A0ABD3Q0C6_9STRA
MWNENMTSVALLALAMVASIRGVESFSNTLHVTTTALPIRLSNPSSALSESFDDEDEYEPPKKKGFFANFFSELDAFVDDATSRRLGNGAQYYGKRKSSFYGKEDLNKKRDRVSPSLVWETLCTRLISVIHLYSFVSLKLFLSPVVILRQGCFRPHW